MRAGTAQWSTRRDRQNKKYSSCPQAPSPDMVPVRELPYGPAASYGRIFRPERWQYSTTRRKDKNPLASPGASTDEPRCAAFCALDAITRLFQPQSTHTTPAQSSAGPC